jgi:transcriptional regulator
MYIPAVNEERDPQRLIELMERHPFATVVTAAAEGLCISHVPLLVRQKGGATFLTGHVARANDHWHALAAGAPTTAIFHGPHAYISPAWYATSPAVPTWNYAVVHVSGPVQVQDDPEAAAAHVHELVARFEPDPTAWSAAHLPADEAQRLSRAIVGFELRAERIEGKLKLGQNRSAADREGAIAQLEAAGDDVARHLAAMMRSTLRTT